MERRSSPTSMFCGDNGNAMNDGINISSKVTNIYKNAVTEACLSGKKKREEKGTYHILKTSLCKTL